VQSTKEKVKSTKYKVQRKKYKVQRKKYKGKSKKYKVKRKKCKGKSTKYKVLSTKYKVKSLMIALLGSVIGKSQMNIILTAELNRAVRVCRASECCELASGASNNCKTNGS